MNDNKYYVYILCSQKYGTLYVGITIDIAKRVAIHKSGLVPGFTKQYSVNKLVYFEIHEDKEEALKREKTLKKWRRDWKINLIERDNPQWLDLYQELLASI